MERELLDPAGNQASVLLGPGIHALDAFRRAVLVTHLTPGQLEVLKESINSSIEASLQLNADGEPLSNAAAHDLHGRIAVGAEARKTLVVHHLGYVLGIAGRYSRLRDEQIELAAVGNLALVDAVRYYKPLPGVKFASFVGVVVRNSIKNHIRRKQRRTDLTPSMIEMLNDITVAHDVAHATGDPASYIETAVSLGFDPGTVREAVRLREIKTISLQSSHPVPGHDGLLPAAERIADPDSADGFEEVLNKLLLEQIWNTATEMRDKGLLSDTEWTILVGRFREGKTLEAIGREVGLTFGAVSLGEARILKKVKSAVDDPKSIVLPEITAPQDVVRPIHLLALLKIPVPSGSDPCVMARQIIEEDPNITSHQRAIMHRLLGTNGQPPSSLARLAAELGVSSASVEGARDRAIGNIQLGKTGRLTNILGKLNIPLAEAPDIGSAVSATLGRAPLTERQRQILHRILGTGGSPPVGIPTIAKEMGQSVGVISRDKRNALRAWREYLEETSRQ